MRKQTLLLILAFGIATLFTACKNTSDEKKAKNTPDEKSEKESNPSAGTGDTPPSLTINDRREIGEILFTFVQPSKWGTRADGTAVEARNVKLWLFYLKDSSRDKTTQDIINAVGNDPVVLNYETASSDVFNLDVTKGVIQLSDPADTETHIGQLSLATTYTFFVRIIHPDSALPTQERASYS